MILEAIGLRKISLIDSAAASENAVAMGGSRIWLELEKMTADELLKAVVVASANDAWPSGEYIAGLHTGSIKMIRMTEQRNLDLKTASAKTVQGWTIR